MKIYATDFDGTLNYGGVSSEVIKAIDKWRAAGNLFGLVTGRPLHWMINSVRECGIKCDFVFANNGAVISDGDGKIIRCNIFSTDDAVRLARHLLSIKSTHIRVDNCDESVEISNNGRLSPDEVFADGDFLTAGEHKVRGITEITSVYDGIESRDKCREYVTDAFGGRINPLVPCPTLVDFVPGNSGKNTAIHEYIKLFGLKPEAIYTTGDSQNDLSMLTDPAFIGFAVPNASQEVIQAVGRIARPIDVLNGDI